MTLKAEETTNWTPVLSEDGQFYCSPCCGAGKFCRKEWYDAAVRKADELAATLGRGWRPVVWENLGWNYRVEKGVMAVHPCEYRRAGFDPANGYSVIEYTAYFNTDKQFISKGLVAEDAVRGALEQAAQAIMKISADIKGVL